VGDIEQERALACEERLRAIGAPAQAFVGPAEKTIEAMVSRVSRKRALCMAYIDPYNLEYLSFSIFQELATLRVDLAINFSTMDLQRNAELEFDPQRARFDNAAPGWRKDENVLAASKSNVGLAFFHYWMGLVKGLGFDHSHEMPLVHNDQGHPIYRMVFFARHQLPRRIWTDIAQGPNRTFEF
jgi:three-Cys-motif partner protein